VRNWKQSIPATALLDYPLLFSLTALLIWPLFKVDYLNFWASPDGARISDARFLAAHWPHPHWQPLWFCGSRFDTGATPAVRYGTALLAKLSRRSAARAYHVYIAFFYCLGVAGVHFFVVTCSQSRLAGWLAAIVVAVASPSYLLLGDPRLDWFFLAPQRLSLLLRYGEGPHIAALAVAPIGLAFAYRAFTRFGRLDAALAALVGAVAMAQHFFGVGAYALLLTLLAWSVYAAQRKAAVWVHFAVIAVLTYALSAFWLTPSYLRVGFAALLEAVNKNLWAPWICVGAALAFVLLSNEWRARTSPYAVFLAGGLFATALAVFGETFGFRVLRVPRRLVPELDLFLILAGAELLRRWLSPAATAASVIAILIVSGTYLMNAWRLFPVGHFQPRPEYRLQAWVNENLPKARVFATGSTAFWYGAWNDLPQVLGGPDATPLNPVSRDGAWHIVREPDAEAALQWLLLLGVDAIIVHEKSSEATHDFAYPEKFRSLPVLYDDGVGNRIYRVPRRYQALARVVDARALDALPPLGPERLRRHVDLLEKGPEATVETHWEGTDVLRIRANVANGQAMIAQASYDSAWRAYSGSQRLPVRADPAGLVRIDAPPGQHDIRLAFALPGSYVTGRILSLIGFAVVAWIFFRIRVPR